VRSLLHKEEQRANKEQIMDKALDKLQKLLEEEILPVAQIDVLTKLIESLDRL